jgi:hypothetical protein
MRKLLVLFALLAVALIVAPGAAANDTPCMGTLTGTHDNVVVPPGAACVLSGATVRGNVLALQDSRLHVATSNVRGNVQGDKADIVQVSSSRVREDIIIKEAGPPVAAVPGFFFSCAFGGPFTPCEALVLDTTIEEGNVQLEKVHGTAWVSGNVLLSAIRGNIKIEDTFASPVAEFMAATSTTVEQNLQVFKNRGPGLKLVSGNTVRESLQCFENELPFTGAPNIARQAQGQCAAAPLPMAFGAANAGPSLLAP